MRALAVAVLAGCYSPPTTCGITCTDRCPGGFTCSDGVCVGKHGECAPPEYAFDAVAVGGRHACGLDARGRLACWGDNTHDQVGLGANLLEAFLPQRLPETWRAVAAGTDHTCAVRDDGTAWCWGDNTSGQAGGTELLVELPEAVPADPGAPSFTQIAAGGALSCAIGDGQLWCWGGVARRIDGDWSQVSIGLDHACGIRGGAVVCWGANDHGQAGAPPGPPIATPQPVALPGAASAVSAGDRASCAIVGGALWCWGIAVGATPVQVGGETSWTAIRPGRFATCGVRGGEAVCWGDAADLGALGDGVWSGTRDPAHAADLGAADAIDLALGDAAFACLRRGSETLCWGDDAAGQLAIGAAALRREPVPVTPPSGHTWLHVAGGRDHVCATTDDRALYCWGSDATGAIRAIDPRGDTVPCTLDAPCDQPRPLPAPAAIDRVTDLVAGDGYTCTREGDAIACWGDPRDGKLGVPAGGGVVSVAPPGAQWVGLAGGERATCGITAPGDPLACWGNIAGTVATQPAALPGPPSVVTGLDAIGLADGFACAHRSDGARVCWGRNDRNQLGDGTTAPRALPVARDVGGFLAVAARVDHACGIRTDRSVACWGDNTAGVAGQPSDATVAQPTTVAGLAGCTQIALGDRHACALCGGTALCWGDNARGALGRGDYDRTTGAIPAPILLTDPIAELALTHRGGCALTTDHTLACWGDGRHGELGNGGQARNVPTPLGARP